MSSEMEARAPGAFGPWPVLDMRARRVLGVLVEKAKTTPDTYPLSLNALTTGCNQKSNRDPLLNLTDLEVEDTLGRCQKNGLAIKITGGRVVRWKHHLYEAWHVDKVDLAVLGELLLRGPQTEGELRSRASRMEPIDDLDALRNVLRPLVERKLVVYLTPEERRGAMLTHGFHDPQERERLRSRIAAEPVAESPSPIAPSAVSSAKDERLSELESGLTEARQEIAALKQTMAGLQEDLRQLKQSLGV
ncbi:MAG: YceH family protein [Gemmataceae bacterium]